MTSVSPAEFEVEPTAEEFVRHHLAAALGGRRGMLEAAIPTAVFTLIFVTTHNLRAAILGGAVLTGCVLIVRVAQRSTAQYALNAAFGVALGAGFAYWSARQGGSVDDQALAYFLPGVLLNTAYAVGGVLTVVIRWPLVGFMIGGVLGDPVGWRQMSGLVIVCGRLTVCLVVPFALRALIQGGLYWAGTQHWMSADAAVSALAAAKLAMGWPLLVASLAAMTVLLGRSSTPLGADS